MRISLESSILKRKVKQSSHIYAFSDLRHGQQLFFHLFLAYLLMHRLILVKIIYFLRNIYTIFGQFPYFYFLYERAEQNYVVGFWCHFLLCHVLGCLVEQQNSIGQNGKSNSKLLTLHTQVLQLQLNELIINRTRLIHKSSPLCHKF